MPGSQPLDTHELDLLAILLHELLSAETFQGKERLVEGNPRLLLSSEADSALAGLLFQFAGDAEREQALQAHRSLLQRCREIGIREAFLELRRTFAGSPLTDSFEQARTQALVDAIGELMTCDTWDDARRWLDAHPELLTLRADAVFEELIRTYTGRGQTQIVRHLVINRDLLRACREIGVEQTFARLADAPDTLEIITENTIAVLVDRPEERESWLHTVELSRVRAAELDDTPMLALLRAIGRLLQGTPPDALPPDLPDAYTTAWARITAAARTGQRRRGNGGPPHGSA